jgi:HAD superfamily hydrolase (TIGR01509 family)
MSAGSANTRPGQSTALLPDRPDLVIFDFDGVVADSEIISLTSLQHTLKAWGIDLSLETVRARYLGLATDKILRDVAAENSEHGAEGFRAVWHDELFARFRRELVPVPGISALLDRIAAAGMSYCIASSGSFERIRIALEAMQMSERFEHVFSSELVQRGKPAPDLFLHAARSLGVQPERAIVIEDSPYGVMAARRAGMRCVGFLGGTHLVEIRDRHAIALRDAGAEMIVESLDQITFDPD